jgi:hypothetical protein
MKQLAFLLIGAAIFHSAFAQLPNPTAVLTSKWNKYANTHHTPGLFLHLDKSVYDLRENIWFSAYLLNKQIDTAETHTLYVSLVNLAQKTQ